MLPAACTCLTLSLLEGAEQSDQRGALTEAQHAVKRAVPLGRLPQSGQTLLEAGTQLRLLAGGERPVRRREPPAALVRLSCTGRSGGVTLGQVTWRPGRYDGNVLLISESQNNFPEHITAGWSK